MVDGESYGIISFSFWKHLFSPSLVGEAMKLQAFYGILYSLIGILTNLSIELGGKTMLINIDSMIGLIDYNNILGCDYIYCMQAMVSLLSSVMTFPHE